MRDKAVTRPATGIRRWLFVAMWPAQEVARRKVSLSTSPNMSNTVRPGRHEVSPVADAWKNKLFFGDNLTIPREQTSDESADFLPSRAFNSKRVIFRAYTRWYADAAEHLALQGSCSSRLLGLYYNHTTASITMSAPSASPS